MHFHTGRLMTAPAAKAALQRTIKLGGGAAYVFEAVKTITAPDQYTLVFHLSFPSPIDLAASAAYSAYIYDTQAAGSGASSSALTKWFNTPHDAGTGPYTVQTWNKGQEFEVILKAYPGYWGGWSGPHYKKVVFRVVTQDSTAAQLLRSGQVSFVEQVSPSVWQSFKGNPGIRTVSAPSWQNLLAQINSKDAEPEAAAGHLLRDQLPGDHRGPARGGRPVQRPHPGRPVRATPPACRTTPTTRPRRRRC